jgi:hypothetical protein
MIVFCSKMLILLASITSSSDRDWGVDIESSGVKLEVFDSAYEITNHSKVDIKEFQLGCTIGSPPKRSIVFRFPKRAESIKSGRSLLSGSIDAMLDEKFECRRRLSKLTVVRLKFQDGGEWRLVQQ